MWNIRYPLFLKMVNVTYRCGDSPKRSHQPSSTAGKGKLNNVFGLLSPLLQVTKGRCIYEIACVMLSGVPLVADTAFSMKWGDVIKQWISVKQTNKKKNISIRITLKKWIFKVKTEHKANFSGRMITYENNVKTWAGVCSYKWMMGGAERLTKVSWKWFNFCDSR